MVIYGLVKVQNLYLNSSASTCKFVYMTTTKLMLNNEKKAGLLNT